MLNSTEAAFVFNSDGELINIFSGHNITVCVLSDEFFNKAMERYAEGGAEKKKLAKNPAYFKAFYHRHDFVKKAKGLIMFEISWIDMLSAPKMLPEMAVDAHPDRDHGDARHEFDLIYLEEPSIGSSLQDWSGKYGSQYFFLTRSEVNEFLKKDVVDFKITNADHPEIKPLHISFDTTGLDGKIPECDF